ncbi:MAG TPA: zinc ribbon domain-containing protein [Ktedonobacterales bacterium]|nr:zinc ribbon domain-containing protein [Ktedonobacterales bacterium]
MRQYDTIAHENLQPANLLRNHHLAQSSAAAGGSACLSLRSCKAADAGTTVVAVPPAFTAQARSGGGVLVHKALSVRWHECPDGGTSRQRDHHAAKTILAKGRASGLAQSPQALPWPVAASVA